MTRKKFAAWAEFEYLRARVEKARGDIEISEGGVRQARENLDVQISHVIEARRAEAKARADLDIFLTGLPSQPAAGITHASGANGLLARESRRGKEAARHTFGARRRETI